MTFTFHPEAKLEFREAIDFYENEAPGLGEQFLEEVHATIQRILIYSGAWPNLSANTRRCLTKRFPYGVIYEIQDSVLIVAVAYLSRRPGYWKERL